MSDKLWELINPSDPYTFYAPTVEVAGVAAAMLSTGFGAKCLDNQCDERTPILFGWDEWLKERGIDDEWVSQHASEIADALDSFLIGHKTDRKDVEDMLAELPPEKREAWRAKRQDRHRTSLSRIGELAYKLAKRLREKVTANA